MYLLGLIRYLRPLDEILPHLEAHRAHLREAEAAGILLAAGPFDPRDGGAVVLRVPDEGGLAMAERLRDADPYTLRGLASYEFRQWNPAIGRNRLDAL